MKKRQLSDVAKTIILLVCCTVAFIIFTAIIANEEDKYQSIENSSYSGEKKGTLALYYGAEEMGKKHGFDVSRTTKSASVIKEKSIIVCFDNMQIDEFENEKMMENIENGCIYLSIGTSVLYDSRFDYRFTIKEETNIGYLENEWDFMLFEDRKPGCGFYVECFPEDNLWQNEALKENSGFAEEFLVMLSVFSKECGVKHVLFNEYYNGIDKSSPVDILKWGFVLFAVQIAVAAVLLMVSVSKRFGAPRIEYSTVKRNENENIYAVASLYQRTKSFDVVFDINMEQLLSDLGKTLGVMRSELNNYNYILEVAEEGNAEKRFRGYGELAKAYKRTDKKIKNKKDLKRKLNIIESIRRTLNDE